LIRVWEPCVEWCRFNLELHLFSHYSVKN
jgi:hypothetical protein